MTLLSKSEIRLNLYSHRVSAGFPSPADDYIDQSICLDDLLIPHPSSTYLVRAEGDSMEDRGIFNGDILVVDRSLTPEQDDIVIAAINGELTCKYLDIKRQLLVPANTKYAPIPIPEGSDFLIEGVVSASLRCHRPCSL